MSADTPKPVRLLVGLGNPGPRYEDTRHNAGYWLVDAVARRFASGFRPEPRFFGEVCRLRLGGGRECWALKPTTYMNRSGQSVSAFCRYYRIEPAEVLVAHDELDLDPGVVRLKRGGGHAGHNGLRDLVKALDSGDFLRLRLGIGHPGHRDRVVDYVLTRASRGEEAAIRDALDRVVDILPTLLDGDVERAMNRLHGRSSVDSRK
ncbi:MAG: aminoacyl-tRNA hydrolase [Chromatiales bacterium]|jgi:PTH1 family peptidyl-tRNA hydrolase